MDSTAMMTNATDTIKHTADINPPSTLVSNEHYEIITQYVERHGPQMVFNNNRRYEFCDVSKQLWEECTAKLNAIGGPVKSSKEWRIVWQKFKDKTKRKKNCVKRKPNRKLAKHKPAKLTSLEKRILAVMDAEKEYTLNKSKEVEPKKAEESQKPIEVNLNSNAMEYYKQLFLCEYSKNSDINFKNPRLESRKSWDTLNSAEKDEFQKQYEKSLKQQKKVIANYVKKLPKTPDHSIFSIGKINENDDDATMSEPLKEVSPPINNEDLSTSLMDHDNNFSNDNISTLSLAQEDNPPEDSIPEPLLPPPPKLPHVMNAEALYNHVNSEEERSWKSLTTVEKKSYYHAVTCLKKEYLRRYKIYLDSLSSADLHKHMMNVINSTS